MNLEVLKFLTKHDLPALELLPKLSTLSVEQLLKLDKNALKTLKIPSKFQNKIIKAIKKEDTGNSKDVIEYDVNQSSSPKKRKRENKITLVESPKFLKSYETYKFSNLDKEIEVNRAPVLTMYILALLLQLGYSYSESLSISSVAVGIFASNHGKSLGIYEDNKTVTIKPEKTVNIMGKEIPVKEYSINEGKDLLLLGHVLENDYIKNPEGVLKSLNNKFKDSYDEFLIAMMQNVNHKYKNDVGVLESREPYREYERIRPERSAGKKGWGMNGKLILKKIIDYDEEV